MTIRVLETVTHVAPFGTRFIDAVTKLPVTDGLQVTAYANLQPQLRLNVPVNASGTFVVHAGPGLRPFLFGAGDDEFWTAIADADKIDYTFEVRDRLGRFLPQSFTVKLPHRGLFTPACLRPPAASNPVQGVPLYSTSARPLPPGMLVLRAQLWDSTAKRAAAYAVVEALEGTVNGGNVFTPKPNALPFRGVSDERGGLAIYLPVPQPDPLIPAIDRRKWSFQLTATYNPPADRFPEYPDLCAVLAQNHLAALVSAAPDVPLAPITVELGHETIVKTSGPVDPASWLHLIPS